MKISKKVVTTTEVDYDITPETIVMTFTEYPSQVFRDEGDVSIAGVDYSVVEVSQLRTIKYPYVVYEVKLEVRK